MLVGVRQLPLPDSGKATLVSSSMLDLNTWSHMGAYPWSKLDDLPMSQLAHLNLWEKELTVKLGSLRMHERCQRPIDMPLSSSSRLHVFQQMRMTQ